MIIININKFNIDKYYIISYIYTYSNIIIIYNKSMFIAMFIN